MPTSLKTLFIFLGLFSGALAQGPASIEVTLSSSMVVVGEKTKLTLIARNATILDWPDSPNAAPLALTRSGQKSMLMNGRIVAGFEYSVSAFREGTYTIPPFKLRTEQGILSSQPLTLRVSPISALVVKGITIKPTTVPYLSGIFLEKKSPYVGETGKVEAKFYLPIRPPHFLRLHDGQVIKMEKEGIAAWRFTADKSPTGVLNYDGIEFMVYTYASSINALRAGPLQIGPGKAEPIFQIRKPSRGRFINVGEALPIEFPAAQVTVRPLPEGAPAGFAGAVGNFSLEATTTAREIKLGDTVTVEARITGRGNIDQFPGPFLVDPEGDWKKFDMIAKPPGSERRSSIGTVEFSQVVRPKKKLPALPPYRFVFFDPVLEKFRTLNTPPHPMIMTGEPVVDLDLDPAIADSGLAFLTPSGRALKTFQKERTGPIWLWQIIPAVLLLLLIITALFKRLKAARLGSLPAREFQAELDLLKAKSANQIEFYREAAKFATTWQGGKGFEELFAKRDDICFRPGAPTDPVPVAERNRIIHQLKTLSPMLLTGFFLLLQFAPAKALSEDPETARTEILREMEASPAPEHFYNLALCEKALEHPAQAALWGYRYEAQGGDAGEIFTGLPGIHARERKGTDWVTLLPLPTYQQMLAAGLWALAFLVIVVRLRTMIARKFILPLCGIICPLGLIVGGLGWFLYPSEISFEPLHELSVITEKIAPLQSQPYVGGSVIRENVAGSLCKITAERADWIQVELPGGITGWTQAGFVETIAVSQD